MADPNSRSWRLAGALRGSLLIAALLLLTFAAPAQQFSYDEFGFNRGLKNAAVNSILQDREGFLWVGTMSGLFRGDGYEFHEFGAADGLPDGTIQDLIEDAAGRLVVATRNGLAVKHSGRFTPVPMSEPVQVYGRSVLALDPQGRLYFATNRGLWIGARTPAGHDFRRFNGLPGPVDSVFVDTAATVWLSADQRLWRLNQDTLALLPAPPGAPARRWDELIQDSAGGIWSRSSRDLIHLPAGGDRFQSLSAGLPGSGFFGSLSIDAHGRVLVPTDSGLAYREGGQWRLFASAHGLPNDSVSVAFQDREGSLWLGLWGSGLIRILGYGVVHSWTTANGLPNSTVTAIQRDRQGRLWAGTDRGLAWLSPDRRTFHRWPGLASAKIRSMALGADGSLWIGSYPGGVARLDPATGTLQDPAGPAPQPFDRVNSLHVDAAGQVWVASIEGLFRSGPNPGSRPVFQRVEVPGAASGEAYFRMAPGAGGVVWVTSSGGLVRFQGREARRFGVAAGLRSPSLTHVAETTDGTVWVAYRDHAGITRLEFPTDGGAPSSTHFLDILSSRSILLLRTSLDGRLWVGGDNGLDLFDGRTWTRFRRAHGLAAYSCAVDAFFTEPDGAAWVGTPRGLTRIAEVPAALDAPRRPIPPVLTWVRFGAGETLIEPAGTLRVAYADRDFSAGMGALSFADRDAVRFRYRLHGKHDTWIETSEREARYADLAPGDYTFELALVPGPGAAAGPLALLRFSVLPPFWMTAWFRVLMGVVILGLVWLIYTLRTRALVAHRQELRGLVAVRTRELEIEKARVAEERDRANAANDFKNEFIARMSHEVRTPVHGVVGMTDLLLQEDLKPEQREMLNAVQDSAGLLIRLLDDVLDLSRLEAGKHDVQLAVFDLRRLALSVSSLTRPAARKKGLDLRLHDGLAHRWHLGDAHKVRQILTNLVSNAVKFTETGSVEIHLSGGAGGGPVRLEVTDTGPGIPPGKLDVLFEPFVQLDASIHPQHGGAGLGLSICKALVTAMDGSIRAESVPGQGSRFVVDLPLPPAEAPEPAPAAPLAPEAPNLASLRVLVAEDNEINQVIVSKMLSALGHAVTVAADGQFAAEHAAHADFDLILMDIRMPRMDGLEATRAIRASGRNAATPIIGLSANVLEADRAAGLDAGMTSFLGKPLRLQELREHIAALHPKPASPARPNPS